MFKNRKGLVTIVSGALIFGLLLTGCGTTNPSAGTSSSNEMKVSYAPGSEPKTLDPQMSNGIPEAIMELNLFEGLMRLDKDSNPQNAIADSIEVSPDGLKYTIKLKDTKWSNGDPVTADDFKFAWMHALDPAAAAEYAYQLFYIKNGEAYNSNNAKAEDVGIKVVDPKTLEITLESPTPYFKSLLAFPTYYPVDKKNVEANPKWNLQPETFVSNGPFKMQSWSHNDKLVLVKNPNYWDADSVKLSELTFNLVSDGKAALTAFEAGQLDGVDQSDVPISDLDRLKQAGSLKTTPYLGTYFYRFNVTKKPLDNPKVRQALSLAINRQALIDNVFKGGQIPALGYVPGGIPDAENGKTFRDIGGELFKEDLAKAKQLLAEAGYPDGKNFPELTILYNTNGSHQLPAQAIQDMWAKNLGINVKLLGQEWKVYQRSEQDLQYDIARAGWIGDYIDPMTFMDMFVTNGGNNQTGWSNADYDKDIQTAKQSGDQKARMQAMHEAEEVLINEMPIMPIYYYTNYYVLKDNIKGVIQLPLGFTDFKYATVEK
ncbi:ABC-type oligopeptide transport system, periplasmic component [Desulfosporosinus orientis DSM 765]|uniref:ABC-type oligopeptide transport system, periplasmic component n=1 Tax=Desulfosporosinus orientis (strain ATCC 19365 / DSM 765 / NCIMB 8382 / VKM B-1628 / Singapore I) TaxID=768706 RepID=G7W5S3_DESOD|nr:peptide ABC transporter substrate-binding protein [Desulfosporosinus orientis]AET67011.1 ABC-type oligopeptide transport system, periplasmic component [Desulfosporosinus orientis DSM 765]